MFYKIPYLILEEITAKMEEQNLQLIDDTEDPKNSPAIYGSIYAELHDKIVEIIENELNKTIRSEINE